MTSLQSAKSFIKNISSSSTGNILLTFVKKNIACITIDNPSKGNSVTPLMMIQLSSIVDELEDICKKDELGGIIVTGKEEVSSPFFCSGLDLSSTSTEFMTKEGGRSMSLVMTDALNRISKLPAISIAAINGFAVGGGAEITTCCDLRIMGNEKYEDKKPFIQFVHGKMGLVPGWGGGKRLVELVGRTNAIKLVS
jgi:ethylmalonyl-CoA/methylmalonyl-CoA decarboxylase